MARHYRTSNDRNRQIKKMAAVLAVLVLVIVLFVILGRVIDSQQTQEDGGVASYATVEINGIKCKPKTRIKTYLFMGVDANSKKTNDTEDEYATNQCDMLELVVIDQNANTYARVPINRNTITEVNSLEEDGTFLATTEVQIALAYANGDGAEISCQNAVDAVSNLFYGQKIDGYAALYMDSIKVLNNLAGGITVTIEDDFSQRDPSMELGKTITLSDEQAVHFVRGRMDVGDGSNEGRMRRQEVYLGKLEDKLFEKLQADQSYALDVYGALIDYMVTSLSEKDCSKLAKAVVENENLGSMEIAGEVSEDEFGFKEFIIDEDSLADVVIDLFYERLE